MPDHDLVIVGPIRLLWRDGTTAAIIDTNDDLKNLPFGVTFAPTDERDADGRPIFREYLETIH